MDLKKTVTRISRPNSTEKFGLHKPGDDLQHVKTGRTKNQGHDLKPGQQRHGENLDTRIVQKQNPTRYIPQTYLLV